MRLLLSRGEDDEPGAVAAHGPVGYPEVLGALGLLQGTIFRVRPDGVVLAVWTAHGESCAEGDPARALPGPGQSIYDHLDTPHAAAVRENLRRVLESGLPETVAYEVSVDGHPIRMDARVAPTGDGNVAALVRGRKPALIREAERAAFRRLQRALGGMRTPRDMGSAIAAEARRLFGHDAFLVDVLYADARHVEMIYVEDTPEGADKPVEYAYGRVGEPSGNMVHLFSPGIHLINRTKPEAVPSMRMVGAEGRASRCLLYASIEAEAGRLLRISVQSYTPDRYTNRDGRLLRRLLAEAANPLVRALAEEQLRQSEVCFRIAAESTGDVVYDADLLTGRVSYHGDVDAMLGYPPNGFPRTMAAREMAVHPEDRSTVAAATKELLALHKPFSAEYRIRRRDGTWRIWVDRGRVVTDGHGRVHRWIGAATDVTAQREAEEALRTGRQQLEQAQLQQQAVLRGTPMGLCLLEANWVISYANAAAHELVGTRGLAGTSLALLFNSEEEFAAYRRSARSRVVSGGLDHREVPLRRHNGEGFWCALSLTRIDPTSTAPGYVATLTDVTERRRTESALAAAELTYRSLVEQALVGIYIAQDGRTAYANPQMASMLGCTVEQMMAEESWLSFVQPEERDAVTVRIGKWLSGDPDPTPFVIGLIRRDGSHIDVETVAARIEHNGRPAVIGTALDVTARRRSERERDTVGRVLLALSAADRLPKVAEIVREHVAATWRHDTVILVARGHDDTVFRPLLALDTVDGGMRPVHVPSFTLTPERLAAQVWGEKPVLVNRWHGEEFQHPEIRMIGDTARKSASLMFAPIKVAGEVVGMITVQSYTANLYDDYDLQLLGRLADVLGPSLERCRAEARSTRLAQAMDQSSDGVNICDAGWNCIYVNDAWCRMTGYTAADVVGRHPRDLLKPAQEDQAQQEEIARVLAEGGVWSGQWRSRRKDGTEYDERVTLSPVFGDDGTVTHYLAVRRDITRELEMEHHARQSQKIEAIGMLAGGVAHDFNNVLQIIMGHANMAANKLDPDDPLRADLETIMNNTRRGAALTRQLLAFSRKQIIKPQHLSLNDVLRGVMPMMRRIISEDVDIIPMPGEGLHTVLADSGQIEQVLINLCTNARDAMPIGGRIFVSTANAAYDASNPPPNGDIPPGEYVVLEVADTGHGMDEATMARVFEPFFTTKPVGKGTGLGLATVYGIVRQCNGHILLESRPGEGTRFAVHLPRSAAPGPDEAGKSAAHGDVRGGETLLVVEDEEELRATVCASFRSLGYSVLDAANGRQALAVLQGSEHMPDLLLTDVVMPEMSGPELVQTLRLTQPRMRVVYMTGYTDSPVVARAQEQPGMEFVQKPVSPRDLAALVRRVLDE